jgi:hypothetical protein
MPKSTVTEEDPYKIPEDTYLPAKLVSVEEKSYPFTIKKGPNAGQRDTFVKWIWEFQIVSGEYAPLKVQADTDPKVTVTPDGSRNFPAMIIEALREMPVEFGEGVDTDDYLSLPCVITVKHTSRDRTDGQGKFYDTPLKDVFPHSMYDELVASSTRGGHPAGEEPPF